MEKYFNQILQHKNCNETIKKIVFQAQKNCSENEFPKIKKILLNILNENRDELKKNCIEILPENLQILRSLIWKINFRYLSHKIKTWEKTLKLKRFEYNELKNIFLLRLNEEKKIFYEIQNNKKISEKEKNDLILLSKNTDKNLLETIEKDVNRTHTNFDFFSKPKNNKKITNEEIKNNIQQKKNCVYFDYSQIYKNNENETHSDVLVRILYIYSKLNKDVSYVQGMNEILAPIYYCFFIDSEENNEKIEADVFWCFSNLMDDVKSVFLKEKDKKKDGIFNVIDNFEMIVENFESEIYKILKKNNVNFLIFCFRWFNLFFCQDFLLNDILKLWDVIFCEKERFNFVYCFALAILKFEAKNIENKEFYEIVEILHKIECENIEILIKIAVEIKNKYEKKIQSLISEKNKKFESENNKINKNNNKINNNNNNIKNEERKNRELIKNYSHKNLSVSNKNNFKENIYNKFFFFKKILHKEKKNDNLENIIKYHHENNKEGKMLINNNFEEENLLKILNIKKK